MPDRTNSEDCDVYANYDYENESLNEDHYAKKIIVGICAMENKVISKPMEEILCRLDKFPYLRIIVFPQPIIIHLPPEDWPQCDCLVCFQSSGFPLDKAKQYVELYNPFVINDIDMQYKLLNRLETYKVLDAAGIPHPRYIAVKQGVEVSDQDDQIEINGETLVKPFVEKPLNAEDHNVYIYFQSSVGGGCQRLFRKIGCRSSIYSNVNKIRNDSDYIYEEFMPTDGIDVKVYTVGSEYAHAEARKSPGLDGKVDRDEYGKEVRYPIILRAEEKMIARKISLAFKQTVCGFDLLRADGKSFVCDVNGFSFVKNSVKYYDDCSLILGNIIMRVLSPHMSIPYSPCFRPEDVPYVATNYGTMMELRCVIAVIRHGDRTPKQKMKMEVTDQLFIDFFEKFGSADKKDIKLKKPSDLQAVLDITRKLIDKYDEKSKSYNKDNLPEERLEKLMQLKSVLEMYGHFSGINRKVQVKKLSNKSGNSIKESKSENKILLILKWGGELTEVGRQRAMLLGEAFRKMYPEGQDQTRSPDTGLLRLHSTYRHDLKIYASDEGRVQMTAAAFTKGLLALEGQLAPILVQMVKSANTNGLLDDNWESPQLARNAKMKLSKYLSVDRVLTDEDISNIVPTGQKALINKLKEIGNPLAACRTISEYINQMTDLIRMRMMDLNSYKVKLYHSESWELMLRRWTKLAKDFYDKETNSFDFGKASVIYDCIKHDYVYNQRTLQFNNARELYTLSKLLSEVVVPQEYGLHTEEKLSLARGIISPLLIKIREDLLRNVDLSDTDHMEDENDSRLDPRRLTEDERYTMGLQTPGRHVRTRLYFTSESHVHSLINVLKYGGLFQVSCQVLSYHISRQE
ncbi:hypothetical protein GJ496_006482 [Pomphorhynchus laevis]|nr:hypothetical protein GJ496_006482 [Pomphorhynchus laevis]